MTEQSDTEAAGGEASGQAPKTDPAHTYPHSWVVDVLASDGGAVALRPIVPEDADKLVEFHGKLSERTRYLRYFGPYPTMSARDVKNFTTVDHHNRVAFVMMLGERSSRWSIRATARRR